MIFKAELAKFYFTHLAAYSPKFQLGGALSPFLSSPFRPSPLYFLFLPFPSFSLSSPLPFLFLPLGVRPLKSS